MAKAIFTFLIAALFCSGCGLRSREEDMSKRETALAEKEQQLLLKEKELSAREEQLIQLEKKIDSVRTDTASHYDEQLVGQWSVKMTCTETTCSGSAVGDTKNESWDITFQDKTIIAKAMNGTELIRTYTGSMTNNIIILTDDVPASESAAATHMQVRLTWADGKNMDGQREIIRENDCRLVYRIQMTKQ